MAFIKWTLYILIVITSTEIGTLISQRYKKRVEELNSFKSAFNILKTKIRFTYAPLKEIFEDIERVTDSKTKMIFKNARENMDIDGTTKAWEMAIKNSETNLTKEDKVTICGLGKLLGKTDINGQISEIDLNLEFLEKQIIKAEAEREKNAKLYKTLGTITGLGIVIILL